VSDLLDYWPLGAAGLTFLVIILLFSFQKCPGCGRHTLSLSRPLKFSDFSYRWKGLNSLMGRTQTVLEQRLQHDGYYFCAACKKTFKRENGKWNPVEPREN
jgi:hypothetical protein